MIMLRMRAVTLMLINCLGKPKKKKTEDAIATTVDLMLHQRSKRAMALGRRAASCEVGVFSFPFALNMAAKN